MALELQFTTVGLAACVSAKNAGLKAEITHMAFGSTAFTPNKNMTSLPSQQEKVEINDYQDGGQGLRMAGVFNGELEYAIRSIGIYLSDGTLLAVYSEPDVMIGYRTPAVRVVQWFTLNIDALPTNSITVMVGTENLNLILDAEFAAGAASFINQGATIIKNAHWNLQLSERIRNME